MKVPSDTRAALLSKVAPGADVLCERVSVVVPCRNEAVWIAALLDALRCQEMRVLEVVVVDTGSTDGTMERVGRYQQNHSELPLRCLSHPGAGVAEAVNRGIEAAQGEIIVRLDGHSRPAPNYVRRSVDVLRETGAGVVGGVWEIAPWAPTRIAEAIACAVAHPIGAGDAAYRTARTTEGGRRVIDTVPFGCFRKATWEALGGFDEGLLTNEDYEFNYRVRSSGSTVVLDPSIRCTYFARESLAGLASQYFRYGWWKAQMLKRYPRSLRWRQALPGALIPLLVCLAVAGLVWPVSALVLGICGLMYGGILLGAAAQVATRQRCWSLVFPLAAAFAVVHGSWSTGLVTNIVSFGRWPRWSGQNQTQTTGGQHGFGGFRLVQALTAILVLTVVVPPGLAKLINWSRVERTQEVISSLVDALQEVGRSGRPDDWEMKDLLGGPGNTPEAPTARQWVDGSVASLGGYVSQTLEPDPWGNRYLVNIGVLRPRDAEGPSSAEPALWVLSAGPNGVVETPYAAPAVSAVVEGDDVGARIAQ